MKYVEKTLRPRLPRELAEKLRHASGGGRHQDKKADHQRRPKHRNKKEDFSSGEHTFATFIRFITQGGESVEECSSERKGGIEMQRHDSAEWILRTVRRILRDVGPKAARRFLESRGGTARWQTAAQEIARHTLREQAPSTQRTFS